MPLKILYAVLPEFLGGAEIHAKALSEAMRQRGHSVKLACSPSLYEFFRKQYKGTSNAEHIYSVTNYDEMAHSIDSFQPDVFQHYNSLTAVAGVELANHRPVSLQVLHANHGLEPDYRHIYTDFTDHIIAVSNSVEKHYPRRKPCPPMSVIPNGIDVQYFSPNPQRRKSEPGLHFITVTRFSDSSKRTEQLLQSYENAYRPGWTLKIVGDLAGSEKIQQRITKRSTKDVSLAGHSSKMPDLYREADVYLQGSLTEGFGLSIAEAAASGLAVLTMNCQGITEYMNHKEDIIISNTWEEFEEMLAELDRDRSLIAKLGSAARVLAVKNFNQERMLTKYERCYLSLVASQKN